MSGPSWGSPEHDGGRASCLDPLAGGRELARGLVHAEGHAGVAVLVRRVEKRPGRIEGEEARRLALGRFPAHGREHAGGRVDREYGEAVVPAVRSVDEAPGRTAPDLLGRAVPREGGRKRGDHL